jgi:hypothetical protein
MKKLFLLLIPTLALAGTEPIENDTLTGHVKQSSSGVGSVGLPFNFSDVFTTGIGGGGGTWGSITGTLSSQTDLQTALNHSRTFTVNVKDSPYNAVGDGVTDDTTAIQSAITAVWNAGGGTVFFPHGTYLCNGAFDGTTNSILKIPWNVNPAVSVVVDLRGETGANFPSYGGVGAGGSTIKSTKSGTGTRPALLATATYINDGGLSTAQFNYTVLYIRDLTFLLYPDPSIDGLRLGESAWASLENVDVFASLATQPTHNTTGITMPNSNNFGVSYCSRTLVQGFATGYQVGEHWMAMNVTAAQALVGLKLEGGFHLCWGSMVLQECVTHISVFGVIPVDFDVDFEDGNAALWSDTTTNILDATSQAHGVIRFQRIKQGVGFVTTPPVVNGGFNLKLYDMYNAPGAVVFSNPGGRLTTESGVPVSTTDRTAQGTLYYTPYKHNNIYTWNGSTWQSNTFTERSLALTVTSGKNYDVFINFAATTLSLSNPWTSDILRADALSTQNGVTVLSSDHTKLWLGTIRADGTNTIADSAGGATTQVGGKRYVWNAYNQVTRPIKVIDTTTSWVYTTNTIRQANAAAGNKVEYVTGDVATTIDASVYGIAAINANSAQAAKVGVGIDSTTTFSGVVQGGYNTGVLAYAPVSGRFAGSPGLGYHAISWNEKGADNNCTFLGNNGGDSQQAGLIVMESM